MHTLWIPVGTDLYTQSTQQLTLDPLVVLEMHTHVLAGFLGSLPHVAGLNTWIS